MFLKVYFNKRKIYQKFRSVLLCKWAINLFNFRAGPTQKSARRRTIN